MQDTVFGYLQQFFGLLTSVSGILCVLAAMFVLLLLGVVPKARWFVLGMLLFIATLSTGADDETVAQNQSRQLPFPLNSISAHSRVLEILVAASLIIVLIRSVKGWRKRVIGAPLFFFFLLNLWMCLRLFSDTFSVARGTLSFISYVLLFLTLGFGIGRSLQSMEDAYAFMKSTTGVAIAFVIANIYYVVRNPASSQGRFWGTTSNPQAVGQTVALLLPSVLCMIHTSRKYYSKLALWAVTGFMVIFLLWSGSRTGVLMTALGVAFFYRSQLKRAAPALVMGVLVTLGAVLLFPQSLTNIERFTDQTNTRAGAWADLISLFKQNPIFGVTFQGTGYGESLYLATLANYGIIGAVPLLLFVLFLVAGVARLFRYRQVLGQHSILVDVLVAEVMMILALSVFESSLLGVWSLVTLLLYLQCGMMAFLSDRIELAVQSGQVVDSSVGEPELLAQGMA